MSTRELEQMLGAWRASRRDEEFGIALTLEEALAFRAAGNVPDEEDRSLRLVLFADDEPLDQKRLRYEPDFHHPPTWRREGSRPVNVVPLGGASAPTAEVPWWEQPRVKELETEWQESGTITGIEVPAELRSFVFKTVIALQDAGEAVTADAIGGSIARWLAPEDAEKVRESLKEKGPGT